MAPYLHKFSPVVQIQYFMGDIWDKFALNVVLVSIKILEIDAETAPFNGAIWYKFSEQH